MYVSYHKTKGGYIALVTAILVSVSLLILTVAVSFEGFFSRFTILESNQKELSIYLAEACAQTAILELAQGNTDVGPRSVAGDTCEIVDKNLSGGNWIIEVQGESSAGAFTNLVVVIDDGDLTSDPPVVDIVSWTEVGNHTP